MCGGGQLILLGQIDLLRQKSLVRQDSLKWDNIYIIIVDLSSATTFIYLGPYLQISATIFILLIIVLSDYSDDENDIKDHVLTNGDNDEYKTTANNVKKTEAFIDIMMERIQGKMLR